MKIVDLLAVSALALMVAAPAVAQGALTGVDSLDDRIDDIQENVADDFAESDDSARFGPDAFTQGWSGSVSLGFTATSGNTDTTDLSLGGRFRYGQGPWSHTIGFAGEFAEDSSVQTQEEIYATYDVNRYFTDQFYVFGLGSVRYDGFATNEWDAFLGVGPGYRVINDPSTTWRVQAGPGVRYTRDQLGFEQTEGAGIVSSRFYHAFTDTVFLTNDTDVLFSDSSVLATNDLGVNFRVTDALTTRVSYRTEFNDDPLPGLSDTDNTFGLSLVVGF